MKYLNKIVLIVMLLSGISTSAQVTQISFNPEGAETDYTNGKIKIENNKLYVIHPSAVYVQELDDSGNLIGNELQVCEMFESFDFVVKDFAMDNQNIWVVTPNKIIDKNAILKSEDGGKTWTDYSSWQFGNLSSFNVSPKIVKNTEIGSTEFYISMANSIFYTSDFGNTFKETGNGNPNYCDLSNSRILVQFCETMTESLDNWRIEISFNRGDSWDWIGSFVYPTDVASHYENSDIMVIVGDKVIVSKDCGESWEEVCKWEYNESDLFIIKADFDVRGSDRLYGFRKSGLLYSDDFGATWAELCEIGLAEDDYVADFVQHGNKIYTYSKNYKVHEIDLELLESAIEEVPADASDVVVSIANGTLQVVSQSQISTIEVFNISGVKILSAENAGSLDISDLAKGTYVASITTSDGKTISRKFNY